MAYTAVEWIKLPCGVPNPKIVTPSRCSLFYGGRLRGFSRRIWQTGGCMETSLFASPRRGVRKEDCAFYHVCDLPGAGQVGHHWDLRDTIDDYLGRYKFSGKTVLDVGTASGFLTFEMEKR